MGDMTNGDTALLLWGVYFVCLMFRFVWWAAKGAADEICEDVLAAVDRGLERGTQAAMRDARKRVAEKREDN